MDFIRKNHTSMVQFFFQSEKIKDQMNIHYLSTRERDICNLLESNNKVRQFFSFQSF